MSPSLKYDTFRKYIKPPFSYSMKHYHSNPNNAYSNLRFEDEYRLFGQSGSRLEHTFSAA